jgi:hypothetical protein
MMSQPNLESVSAPSVLKKKPQLNIYTVLLIIALVSLLIGCTLLWLELDAYGGFGAIKGRISMLGGSLRELSPTLRV